ncbi:MAG: hypothetical protein KBB86_00565 [Candidatus Pacebacteria bacterium]|nr:hypothetical protein [Candidatus Paceibacterota bacterium]
MINKKNTYFVSLNKGEQGTEVQKQKNAILNFLMAEKRVVIICVKNDHVDYIKNNYKIYYEDYFPKDATRIFIYMLLVDVGKDFFTGELRESKSPDDDSRVVKKFENPVDFPRGLKLTLPIDLLDSVSIL